MARGNPSIKNSLAPLRTMAFLIRAIVTCTGQTSEFAGLRQTCFSAMPYYQLTGMHSNTGSDARTDTIQQLRMLGHGVLAMPPASKHVHACLSHGDIAEPSVLL